MYKDIYLVNEEATKVIGEKIGNILIEGSFVCLYGDLGAGKTHLAKAIAVGMGVTEPVSSPTFTIVQEYMGQDLELLHFDVYRVSNSEELEFIGFDDYLNRKGIIVMEWAERVKDILPDRRVDIYLKYCNGNGRLMDININDDRLCKSFEALIV